MENKNATSSLSVGCVLLAGGKSSRMGRNKALLEIGGVTCLERIAAELSGFSERLLSGGSSQLAQMINFRHIPDEYPDCGPMGGLYSALKAAHSETLFVVACDMPFFSRKIPEFLIGQSSADDSCIVCIDPGGHLQPLCGIYTKKCLPLLQRCLTDGKLKMLPTLEELGVRKLSIPHQIAEEKCFLNINTPEDLPH